MFLHLFKFVAQLYKFNNAQKKREIEYTTKMCRQYMNKKLRIQLKQNCVKSF